MKNIAISLEKKLLELDTSFLKKIASKFNTMKVSYSSIGAYLASVENNEIIIKKLDAKKLDIIDLPMKSIHQKDINENNKSIELPNLNMTPSEKEILEKCLKESVNFIFKNSSFH